MPTTTNAVRFPDGEVFAYSDIWADDVATGRAELLKGKAAAAALKEYRRGELLKVVTVGTTLRVVCTHRSRNGTSQHFRVFVACLDRNGRPYVREITRQVADLCGMQTNRDTDDIVMGGGGYSKSFQIGYSLGRALWPDGTPEPHSVRNGEPDTDGGYAINVN